MGRDDSFVAAYFISYTISTTCCSWVIADLQDVPLISKSNAKQQYLLSDGDLLPLKWMERKNPQRSSWTNMKLYLEREVQVRGGWQIRGGCPRLSSVHAFHPFDLCSTVQAVSYKKYGDQAGLEAEARRRVTKKLDKRVQEREDKLRREERRVKRVKEIREGITGGVGKGMEAVVAGDEQEEI